MKKPKKKQPVAIVDLSNTSTGQRLQDFEVSDYDYLQLQSSKTAEQLSLDDDLEYLLSDQKIDTLAYSRIVVTDVTISKEELRFSELLPFVETMNSGVLELATTPKKKKRSKKKALAKKNSNDNEVSAVEVAHITETTKPSRGKAQESPVSKASSDSGTNNKVAREAVVEKKPKKTSKSVPVEVSNLGNHAHPEQSDVATVIPSGAETPSIPAKQKRKRNRKRKQKGANSKDSPPALPNAADTHDSIDPGLGPESVQLENTAPDQNGHSQTPEPPLTDDSEASAFEASEDVMRSFALSLEPGAEEDKILRKSDTAESTGREKSASPSEFGFHTLRPVSKSKSAFLPEIQPTSCIFGITNSQIMKLKPNDVKLKTIRTASSLSKRCRIVLDFTVANTETLFSDEKRRRDFVDLAVNVALFESRGFKKTVTRLPLILEWLEKYDEFTLSRTHTSLTISTNKAHSNDFDYSILALYGHILIWINHVQQESKLDQVLKKLDVLGRDSIKDVVGGAHLWDRLHQTEKINLKRWKHIQKFRQQYPFEIHQFVYIYRFMNLGSL